MYILIEKARGSFGLTCLPSTGAPSASTLQPSELGQLDKLTYYFYLRQRYGSGSAGTMPTQLGQLVGMRYYLNLDQSSFTGTLPSEIGSLTEMSGRLVSRVADTRRHHRVSDEVKNATA